jgi:hypothetical protein
LNVCPDNKFAPLDQSPDKVKNEHWGIAVMLTTLIFVWLGVGIVMMLIGVQDRRYSAGMPLAYFLGLSLIHVPGAAVYANFPVWDALTRRTTIGFEQTVIGMVAFLVGVIIVRYMRFLLGARQRPKNLGQVDLARFDRMALVYLGGGFSYFFLEPLIYSIASVGAVIAQLSSCLIVGASLRMWVAHRQGHLVKFWIVIGLMPLLPIVEVIRRGFIGFGTYWLLSGLSFAFSQSKQRVGYFIIAPFAIYFGLSIFVNYMASRTAYREAVWLREIGIAERVERVADMFRNFQWFDGDNAKHREVVDGRLNQNLLVGAAVERLELGMVDYAHGQTLIDMAISLVPRALWPDKPDVGGGGTVAQDYAGLKVAKITSVGAGQVLEFYINFGTWGVIGGFLVYGFLIGWMDLRIIESLNRDDLNGFLRWFMMCLAMLQPGGNLREVITSVAASAIGATALGYSWNRWVSANSAARSVESKPIA